MKRYLILILMLLCFGGSSAPHASAQNSNVNNDGEVRRHPLAPAEVERVVRRVTENETVFRRALNQYAFKRDAVVQTIGMGGQISGEYHRTSQFVFGEAGNRYERITFFPMPTLNEISFTPEDLEDLGGVQQFALEAAKVSQYSFSYVGKEKIDELDLYVFDVAPKVMPDYKKTKERFFQGRIWVDDRDLQIVKARGKGVPEGKQRFPTFETFREQIDGKYWFPTYSYADDTLVFPGGQVVRIRSRVRYTEYKKPSVSVEVLPDEGEADIESEKELTPAKPPRF